MCTEGVCHIKSSIGFDSGKSIFAGPIYAAFSGDTDDFVVPRLGLRLSQS